MIYRRAFSFIEITIEIDTDPHKVIINDKEIIKTKARVRVAVHGKESLRTDPSLLVGHFAEFNNAHMRQVIHKGSKSSIIETLFYSDSITITQVTKELIYIPF